MAKRTTVALTDLDQVLRLIRHAARATESAAWAMEKLHPARIINIEGKRNGTIKVTRVKKTRPHKRKR